MSNPTAARSPTITLPPGTLRIEIEAVPQLIAEALYPRDACNGPMTVSYLDKVTPGNSLGEPVTASDRDMLNSTVWAKLPPYQDGIDEMQWREYHAAFDAAKMRLPWIPVPVWINPSYNGAGGAMMRALAEEQHAKLLHDAVAANHVTAITHAGAPIPNALIGNGVYLSTHELARYLMELPLPIELRIGESDEQEPPARALPVTEQHAQTVLAAIRAANYDPMMLPKRLNGRKWVKAEMRKKCTRLTKSQFNKAWERLKSRGAIAENANPTHYDAPKK